MRYSLNKLEVQSAVQWEVIDDKCIYTSYIGLHNDLKLIANKYRNNEIKTEITPPYKVYIVGNNTIKQQQSFSQWE